MHHWLFLFLLFFLILIVAQCDTEMTVTIDPGDEICFYQPLEAGNVFEIDYQVIDGGQGELDISFYFRSPDQTPLIMDYKRPENTHRVDITASGSYQFCFDNRFSSFNRKTVFFALITDGDDSSENIETFSEEENYEIAIDKIEQILTQVKKHLTDIRHMQDASRASEARDRNVAESNYVRVNRWSLFQIIVMIIVGMIQVVMVKSLFDDQSVINRIARKGFSTVW